MATGYLTRLLLIESRSTTDVAQMRTRASDEMHGRTLLTASISNYRSSFCAGRGKTPKESRQEGQREPSATIME
jgi:hypothetical protein